MSSVNTKQLFESVVFTLMRLCDIRQMRVRANKAKWYDVLGLSSERRGKGIREIYKEEKLETVNIIWDKINGQM